MSDCTLDVRCELTFDVTAPTPMVFMLRPRSDRLQTVVSETYVLSPQVEVIEATDSFGNISQRLVAQPGDFSVSSEAQVRVVMRALENSTAPFISVQELPPETLTFLLPSRYCESDRFGSLAQEIVAGLASGYSQVQAICEWVRTNIRNTPLSSTYPVSAAEVNQRGEGVCRDLAHVAISLCRALCIPTRMAVGYLHNLEPMDIHAWLEAYVGHDWYAFDPSVVNQNEPRVTIARGRDATDVAIYNQYGPLLLPTKMMTSVILRAESGAQA